MEKCLALTLLGTNMNRSEIIANLLEKFKGIFTEEEIAKIYKELLAKFNLAK